MSIEDVMRLARGRADDHTRARADRLGQIAVEKHRDAPRGGINTNRYGQPRSAPGEAPAVEEGDLLDKLEVPPVAQSTGHWRVFVNHGPLEYGARRNGKMVLLPRPLGRLSLDELKQEVG